MRTGMRVAVVALMVLVACSSGASTPTTESATIEGVPAERYNAAVAEWDAGVAEWDALTKERDRQGASEVVVNGQTFESYKEWAQVNGKPLTFEEVLAKYR